MTGTLIAEVIPSLDWHDAIPASPVRLKKLRNHASVDAEFHGVPFQTYIVVENLYQGFLSTQKDDLLDDLALVLYPGCSATLTAEERISIFYWVASLKDMFARCFPDFFQPATANAENLLGSSPNIGKQLQESMDAQIRALTKGDITKANDYIKQNHKDGMKIEIEVRNFDELNQAIETGGIDRIMLDNFTPADTRKAVEIIAGRYETESSGGITFDTLRQYGECGVDYISVGALTHSVKGLDMSFKAC